MRTVVFRRHASGWWHLKVATICTIIRGCSAGCNLPAAASQNTTYVEVSTGGTFSETNCRPLYLLRFLYASKWFHVQLTGYGFSRLLTQHLRLVLEKLKQTENLQQTCQSNKSTQRKHAGSEAVAVICRPLGGFQCVSENEVAQLLFFNAVLHNHTAGLRPENMEKSSVWPPCGSLLWPQRHIGCYVLTTFWQPYTLNTCHQHGWNLTACSSS